jgi:hypothetical protein
MTATTNSFLFRRAELARADSVPIRAGASKLGPTVDVHPI